jgi:acyl-coenzyme A synthetase/AMP-(fatty) acid ligase
VEAAVVARAGTTIDEAVLRAWCRARLAGYKTPRAIVTLPSLPRTASGKLRRRDVAAVVARAAADADAASARDTGRAADAVR